MTREEAISKIMELGGSAEVYDEILEAIDNTRENNDYNELNTKYTDLKNLNEKLTTDYNELKEAYRKRWIDKYMGREIEPNQETVEKAVTLENLDIFN